MPSLSWFPTHKLILIPASGQPKTCYLMVVNGFGYTLREWEADEVPGWVENGHAWYYQGRLVPPGYEQVVIAPVESPAAMLGRVGGENGTGASKRRSPEHYARMSEERWKDKR